MRLWVNANWRCHVIYTPLSLQQFAARVHQTLKISIHTGQERDFKHKHRETAQKIAFTSPPPPPPLPPLDCVCVCTQSQKVAAIFLNNRFGSKKKKISFINIYFLRRRPPPAVQLGFRYLKSNLSISGHQTIPKCQWRISLWLAPTIRDTFWCPRTLSSSFRSDRRQREWEAGWERGRERKVGGGGSSRRGPDETPSGRTPTSCQLSPPVARDAPHSSAAIKGCLPTSAPWVGCQPDESQASLLTKRGGSREPLNHSATRRSDAQIGLR